MKRPAFQFYPSDWRKDMALQSCSVAARGLWIDLLCIAHECEPYGHLTVNGKPMTAAQIGRHTGLTQREAERLLAELEEAGVTSRTDDGVIYSRRMVRDEELRQKRAAGGEAGAEHGAKGAAHGIKGGRPRKVKAGSGDDPNGGGDGGRGVSKPPSEPPKEPPPSSSSSSSPSGKKQPLEDYHAPTREADPPSPEAPDPDVTGHAPTPAGAVTRALRQAGIANANPGHPRLQALVAAGATADEFVAFAAKAIGRRDPFAYVLGAVEGERQRAAEIAATGLQGPLPTPQRVAAEPAWVAERKARAAAFLGPLATPAAAAKTPDNVIDLEVPRARLALG